MMRRWIRFDPSRAWRPGPGAWRRSPLRAEAGDGRGGAGTRSTAPAGRLGMGFSAPCFPGARGAGFRRYLGLPDGGPHSALALYCFRTPAPAAGP